MGAISWARAGIAFFFNFTKGHDGFFNHVISGFLFDFPDQCPVVILSAVNSSAGELHCAEMILNRQQLPVDKDDAPYANAPDLFQIVRIVLRIQNESLFHGGSPINWN